MMTSYTVNFEKRPEAKAKLFCFPYAGASAAVYRPWNAALPPELELTAVEIPGRVHLREQPAEDMEELVDRIFPEITQSLDKPFIFFAHSFGSIIAYEVAKRLQEQKKTLPKALFVSSRRAPQIPNPFPPTAHLSDEDFLEVMQHQYEAVPKEVLKEKELLQLLLPILKADIRLNETYLEKAEEPLNIPLTIYYGTLDKTITLEHLKAWEKITSKEFKIKGFEGGHFFLNKEHPSIIKDVLSLINKEF